MNIKVADESNLNDLVAFNQAMALETEGKQLDEGVLIQGVARVFKDRSCGFYLVAEEGGQIIGGLLVTYEWSDWRNGWFWWIQSVYVTPEYRGKGVYSKLHEYVIEMARKNTDVRGLRLYVEKQNSVAQKVYRNIGMSETYYLMYEQMIDG